MQFIGIREGSRLEVIQNRRFPVFCMHRMIKQSNLTYDQREKGENIDVERIERK